MFEKIRYGKGWGQSGWGQFRKARQDNESRRDKKNKSLDTPLFDPR